MEDHPGMRRGINIFFPLDNYSVFVYIQVLDYVDEVSMIQKIHRRQVNKEKEGIIPLLSSQEK